MGQLDFLQRPMPPLPQETIAAVKSAPATLHSNGSLYERGIVLNGRVFLQQSGLVTTSQLYGASPDSDAVIYDPNLINWNRVPIQEIGINDTNYGAVYDPVSGAWDSYFLGTDDSSWKDIIIAAVMIVGGYYGGTYLSEAYGAAGVGAGEVGLSGMDLAADAGMGSVNSGGATWGGLGTGADTVATGDYFDFSDLYDNIDLPTQDAGSFDPGSFDWDYGNYQWDTYDSSSLFPDANATAPVAPDYPIPEIQITPATAASGISYTLPSIATVKEVLGLALTAASMVRAFQDGGGRVQDPSASNRSADCATGMILTRNTAGQVSAMRPAVGVATVTTDGGLIINNGDGTYVCISPTGQQVTKRYSTTTNPAGVTTTGTGMFGGIDPKILMIGGAALVGVLLLSQRRG